MSDSILSEDGFWELVDNQWIATEKQQFALENGATPHYSVPITSDDGYWELIDGEWKPTQKQTGALRDGAIAYDTNQHQLISNVTQSPSQLVYYYANTSSKNTTTLLIVGGGFLLAFLLSIILIIASISPDMASDSVDNSSVYDGGDGHVFSWEYQSNQYSISLALDKETYNFWKSKDHTCCYEDEDYLKYSTPDAGYVIETAQSLEDMAIANGHTSQLEKAEFILAFVGTIPYVFDPDDDWDHPKYPIETLWENGGDCEDSSALYASLMEALGYQTILVLLEAKYEPSDTWGGHALVGIHIPNHSGDSFTLSGDSKSYFIAETTAWYDESDGIGIDLWYDLQNITTYAIN